MSDSQKPSWFRQIGSANGQSSDSTQQIIWFPHAGGGAAPLIQQLRQNPTPHNFLVATLPGRETRYNEAPCASLSEMVDRLDEAIPDPNAQLVLIGHSFGALVAYLIALKRCERGHPPAGLVVMAMTSPDRAGQRESIAHLDEEPFAVQLDERYGGIPDALKANREAMSLFLPIVRHDMRLLDAHRYVPGDALATPIKALAGSMDRAAGRADMQAWKSFTQREFSMRVLPGGHFFPFQNLSTVLEMAGQFFLHLL